jgi:hypothetical protein
MSQTPRKYKLLDEFLSRVRLVPPDSPSQTLGKKPDVRTAGNPGSAAGTSPAGSWQTFFSGMHRGSTMGFAFRQEKVTVLEENIPPLSENALRVPLALSGKTIGSIQVAEKESGWTAQEMEIIGTIAAQLALHLEHLQHLKQSGKTFSE